MESIKRMPLIVMIIMAIVSFTNLFGLQVAGASVIIGVVFFFINKAREKESDSDSGFDIKTMGKDLSNSKIWIWIALPLIMDIVSITIAKLFLPGYINHVIARAGIFVSYDKIILLLPQLIFLALGEEIAWRAFFQKQLNKALPITQVLLISSVFFAFGHLTKGNPIIVAYDIFFVFMNSILYGIIFHKSNNAWVSTLSHFVDNLFSVIVLVFI